MDKTDECSTEQTKQIHTDEEILEYAKTYGYFYPCALKDMDWKTDISDLHWPKNEN